jgi:hypothetical protein
MEKNMEKRACERWKHNASIAVSYFNQESSINTQTLNHSLNGMCFKSSFFFQPGTSLFIRVLNFNPDGSNTVLSEGLRSVSLAEVKWCCEAQGEESSQFLIGVKYFAPVF